MDALYRTQIASVLRGSPSLYNPKTENISDVEARSSHWPGGGDVKATNDSKTRESLLLRFQATYYAESTGKRGVLVCGSWSLGSNLGVTESRSL